MIFKTGRWENEGLVSSFYTIIRPPPSPLTIRYGKYGLLVGSGGVAVVEEEDWATQPIGLKAFSYFPLSPTANYRLNVAGEK